MAATASIDAIEWLRKQVEAAPDGLRTMLTEMVNLLMSAEVDALCGAGYGERSEERVNSRSGYRGRPWDTRVGTIALQIPKLRQGTYFPGWLLEPRRRAEKALTSVIAEAYLLGVSTRKVEDLVRAVQPRDPPAHGCRRHLPAPPEHGAPRRRGAVRAQRRLGRRAPLLDRREPRRGAGRAEDPRPQEERRVISQTG